MSGPFDFNAIGDSARMREVTRDNGVSDMLMGLSKPPEQRDLYDQASIQRAPLASGLWQLARLLMGK